MIIATTDEVLMHRDGIDEQLTMSEQILVWYIVEFMDKHTVYRERLVVFLLELKLLAEREWMPSIVLPDSVKELIKMLKDLKHIFLELGIDYEILNTGCIVEIVIRNFMKSIDSTDSNVKMPENAG